MRTVDKGRRCRPGRPEPTGRVGPVSGGAERDCGTVGQLQVRASSLECDLAGRPSRTYDGAGAGEALRDQLRVANREAERLSQMSRRLEGGAGWPI